MIVKILSKDEFNVAMAVALTGALALLLAKGDGPNSLGRVVTGALSNPIPRTMPDGASRPAPADLGVAA